jgi:hypothetical protein
MHQESWAMALCRQSTEPAQQQEAAVADPAALKLFNRRTMGWVHSIMRGHGK